MANPIAVPGTNVPSGAAVSPGGAQGPTGVSANANNKAVIGTDSLVLVQGTAAGVAATTHAQTVSGDDPQLTTLASATTKGLLNQVSGNTTDFVDGTNNCRALSSSIWKGFVSKTAAYTLTTVDSGKYIVCSGGSWTLTLPAPAVGLVFQVRNDMGISGTTGTITLSPTGGTIDGLASIPLLPQQECTLITDGTNWRTYGLKREVILGTQDVTVATAALTILLPIGYRVFDLDITACNPVTDNVQLQGLLSTDGGSTFLTQYWYSVFYTLSQSTISGTAPSTAQTAGVIGGGFAAVAQGVSNQAKMTLFPGSSVSLHPSWISDSMGYSSSVPVYYQHRVGLFGPLVGTPVNAIKILFNTGNIANLSLTVKGKV